jgi:DNA-binding transcriptional MerR regulator
MYPRSQYDPYESLLDFCSRRLECFKHLSKFCLKQNQLMMHREFTSSDVMALTGISARQLQWWDERGLVAPARQGHRRIYSWDELVTVAVTCQLRRRGFSLQRMRKVIRFLQQEFGTTLAATVGGSSESEYHLLTDGTRLYLRTSARQVVDLLKNARQPMFDICLSDEVRRVRAEIRARRKSAGSEQVVASRLRRRRRA